MSRLPISHLPSRSADRHHPVSEHHDHNARGPQEVDVTVATSGVAATRSAILTRLEGASRVIAGEHTPGWRDPTAGIARPPWTSTCPREL
jgi:hypothetical protein